MAITGSMNQLGQVQPSAETPILEGFLRCLQIKDFTDKQGVIIPRQNMQHLDARQDVIEAGSSRSVPCPIDTIDRWRWKS